jgi:catechol 2,3-dioxygenase-like lactoylglutathione lyase family enzyme
MNDAIEFVAAVPVLASLDIQRSVDFFAARLGFTIVYASQGEYGIVSRGAVELHFWACSDPAIASATGCRVGVVNIESLYAHCVREAIVHPNGPLHTTPWGKQEFAILDPDHNLVTFFEPVAATT